GQRGPHVNAQRAAATLAVIALLDLSTTATAAPLASKVRHPVALAASREGDRLFVANLRSGSLSVVDPRAKAVLSEHDRGCGLSDVAVLPAGARLVAVDQAAGALLLVAWRDGKARVVDRHDVGDEPTTVVVRPGGASCVVAVTGSRRLFAVAITPPGKDRD